MSLSTWSNCEVSTLSGGPCTQSESWLRPSCACFTSAAPWSRTMGAIAAKMPPKMAKKPTSVTTVASAAGNLSLSRRNFTGGHRTVHTSSASRIGRSPAHTKPRIRPRMKAATTKMMNRRAQPAAHRPSRPMKTARSVTSGASLGVLASSGLSDSSA